MRWLASEPKLHGWWLCYDADEALVHENKLSCLAYFAGFSVRTVKAAMGCSGLIGQGIKSKKRMEILGVPMQSKRKP